MALCWRKLNQRKYDDVLYSNLSVSPSTIESYTVPLKQQSFTVTTELIENKCRWSRMENFRFKVHTGGEMFSLVCFAGEISLTVTVKNRQAPNVTVAVPPIKNSKSHQRPRFMLARFRLNPSPLRYYVERCCHIENIYIHVTIQTTLDPQDRLHRYHCHNILLKYFVFFK